MKGSLIFGAVLWKALKELAINANESSAISKAARVNIFYNGTVIPGFFFFNGEYSHLPGVLTNP